MYVSLLLDFLLPRGKAGQEVGPANQEWDFLCLSSGAEVALMFLILWALQQQVPAFADELMELLKA